MKNSMLFFSSKSSNKTYINIYKLKIPTYMRKNKVKSTKMSPHTKLFETT